LQRTGSASSVADELAALFRRNGCVRRQNAHRVATEDWTRYKKGNELRLTANSEAELERIRQLLAAAGFKLARPHSKGKSQYRQPVYGSEEVERFLEMIGAE